MDDFGVFYELHVTAVTGYVARSSDPDGPCRMRIPTPLRVRSTSVISSLPAGRDDVVRPSFLSSTAGPSGCAQRSC